jgi:hypothetical protein
LHEHLSDLSAENSLSTMDFSGEKKMDSWENMMTLMNREVSSLFE